MDWSQLLFSFQGRVNRGKYWLVGFLVIAIWIAFFVVAVVMLGSRIDDLMSFAGASLLLWLFGFVLFVVTIWAGFAVGVKRLHDRNKSGWWILLFYFAPGILSGWQASSPTAGNALVLGLASFAITVWSFVELGCLRGTAGPNQYGPDPLNRLSIEPLR